MAQRPKSQYLFLGAWIALSLTFKLLRINVCQIKSAWFMQWLTTKNRNERRRRVVAIVCLVSDLHYGIVYTSLSNWEQRRGDEGRGEERKRGNRGEETRGEERKRGNRGGERGRGEERVGIGEEGREGGVEEGKGEGREREGEGEREGGNRRGER